MTLDCIVFPHTPAIEQIDNMATPHKNKTLATLAASLLGGLGLHRFYLYGKKDMWGWLHFGTAPLSLAALAVGGDRQALFLAMPFVLSILSGFLEALVIGLTPDDKWDARHNAGSGRLS